MSFCYPIGMPYSDESCNTTEVGSPPFGPSPRDISTDEDLPLAPDPSLSIYGIAPSMSEYCPYLRSLPVENITYTSPVPFFLGKFENLAALRGLALINIPWTTLPEEITELTELRSLTLIQNGLHEIPDEIGRLSQLTKLVISINSIRTLPATIAHCSNLEALELQYDTELSYLPSEVATLPLKTLALTKSHLETFPNDGFRLFADAPPLAPFYHLRYLDISWSHIDALADNFTLLCPSLRKLDLTGNALATFPFTEPLKTLEVLDLSCNRITAFPDDWPSRVPSLRALNLLYNPLKRFPVTEPLTSLEVLQLPAPLTGACRDYFPKISIWSRVWGLP